LGQQLSILHHTGGYSRCLHKRDQPIIVGEDGIFNQSLFQLHHMANKKFEIHQRMCILDILNITYSHLSSPSVSLSLLSLQTMYKD